MEDDVKLALRALYLEVSPAVAKDVEMKVMSEIERLRDALRAASGGCRMLSEGDKCDCGLCKRDNEISRFRTALRQIIDQEDVAEARAIASTALHIEDL